MDDRWILIVIGIVGLVVCAFPALAQMLSGRRMKYSYAQDEAQAPTEPLVAPTATSIPPPTQNATANMTVTQAPPAQEAPAPTNRSLRPPQRGPIIIEEPLQATSTPSAADTPPMVEVHEPVTRTETQVGESPQDAPQAELPKAAQETEPQPGEPSAQQVPIETDGVPENVKYPFGAKPSGYRTKSADTSSRWRPPVNSQPGRTAWHDEPQANAPALPAEDPQAKRSYGSRLAGYRAKATEAYTLWRDQSMPSPRVPEAVEDRRGQQSETNRPPIAEPLPTRKSRTMYGWTDNGWESEEKVHSTPITAVQNGGMLEVRGKASQVIWPDTVTFQVSATIEALDSQSAQQRATDIVQQAKDALLHFGLQETDIELFGYNIACHQETGDDVGQLVLFRASQSLRVTLKDFTQIEDALDAVMQKGMTEVGNLSYAYSQRDAAYQEALRAAVQSAKDKAQVLADAAGVRLQKLVTLRESTEGNAAVMKRVSATEQSAGLPGEMEVIATVELVYEVG